MTIVDVNGVKLNTCLSDFYSQDGLVQPNLADQITQDMAGIEIARDFREQGILFPIPFAFDCFRFSPAASEYLRTAEMFGDTFLQMQRKIALLDAAFDLNPIRRLMAALHMTTTVSSFEELSREVWDVWVGAIKQPNTQWRSEFRSTDATKMAFNKVAQYLDTIHKYENYSFLRPVRILRAQKSDDAPVKGRNFLTDTPPDMVHVKELFIEWVNAVGVKSIKQHNAAFLRFASWLELYPVEERSNFLSFLQQQRRSPSWLEFNQLGYSMRPPTSHGHRIQLMIDFVDWVLESYMTTNDDGESSCFGFPLVDPKDEKQLRIERQYSFRSKAPQAVSIPLPLRYIKKLKQILRDSNWKWPKSLEVHQVTVEIDGVSKVIWNPVFAYLVYGMLEMPWRKIQFLSLDSGEGDLLEFDVKTSSWKPNKSPNAGYWQRDILAKRKHRGVVAYNGVPENGVGFYVNTNKTADIEVGFGEASGYFSPWQNNELIQLFYELRNWQMKFNPVSGPVSYRDAWVAFDSKSNMPTERIFSQVPDRFYLFRDIQSKDRRDIPPTVNRIMTFWRLLMDELERRLRDEGEDVNIITSRNESGAALASYYSMHGLRVAGLTAFAEAGVPIEILSKLVAGHASILMTLYYVKYTTKHVTDVLTNARKEIDAKMASGFKKGISSKTLDEALQIAVAAENYTVKGIVDGTITPDLFFDVGFGICPYAGTRCSDGVQTSATRTAPVPGGPRNCLQCRHFVTGLPWLVPLILNQQKYSAEVQTTAQRCTEIEQEIESLKKQRAEYIKSRERHKIPFQVTAKLAQLQSELERLSLEMDEKFSNMHRQQNFIDRIIALDKQNSEKLPVSHVEKRDQMPQYRECSRLELIDSVIQGSRIYPFLADKGLEIERQQFIDLILYNNNMVPISALQISDDLKKRAADAAAELLVRKYDVAQIQALASGAQSFDDLGGQEDGVAMKMANIISDLKNVILVSGA